MKYYNFSQIVEIEKFTKIKVAEFGREIKENRLRRHFTQERLAELASINTKYLGEIERGKKRASGFVIYKIAKALDVPVCQILSTNSCAYENSPTLKEILELLAGMKQQDLLKAKKMLEGLFT